jgi:hypothetical protein
VRRRGFSVLMAVCLLLSAAGIAVMAFHTQWRGSSRTLHSVQEHRTLINLARSAANEALYRLQVDLDQGKAAWIEWATRGKADKPFDASTTIKYAQGMTADPSFLSYTVEGVTLKRIRGATKAGGLSGHLGELSIEVDVKMFRASPRHSSALKLTSRHSYWFSDSPTPFSKGGRHIEVLPNPIAQVVELK